MAEPALRQDPVPIVYPERDGKPMAETETHREEMVSLIGALQVYFRDATDLYICGNMLFYYEEGNPKACCAPDVFVVKGVARHRRRIYKLWEEKKIPSLVIEVTSKSTRQEDLVQKRELYASLGVEEYFLHDPLDEYLDPPFQGFRLDRGHYRPIPRDPDGGFTCHTVGLRLRRDGLRLRWIDAHGRPLPDLLELDDERRATANERDVAQAARFLEAKARRKAEEARQVAEEARLREAEARQAAEDLRLQEAEGRKAAEKRAAELEAELARLRQP